MALKAYEKKMYHPIKHFFLPIDVLITIMKGAKYRVSAASGSLATLDKIGGGETIYDPCPLPMIAHACDEQRL